jgi:putative NIF3 family GTP cyclohydrolase 1 type 2
MFQYFFTLLDSSATLMTISRRQFALASAAALAACQSNQAQHSGVTAQEIVSWIQAELLKAGVEWSDKTVDTFKAGDPDIPVTGIVTSVMSTLDVLQRTVAAGKNMVITHEPTYFNGSDVTDNMQDDALYRHKLKYINDHKLVVWRFHDHWHRKKIDGMQLGLAKLLGWNDHRLPDNDRSYSIPEMSLREVATHVRDSLGIKTIRVVGDPETQVSRVALNPGYTNIGAALRAYPTHNLMIIGEAREWEVVEYAFDAATAGQGKGLIVMGHTISEDPGMNEAASWLRSIISEVPIEFIPAGEPFWTP